MAFFRISLHAGPQGEHLLSEHEFVVSGDKEIAIGRKGTGSNAGLRIGDSTIQLAHLAAAQHLRGIDVSAGAVSEDHFNLTLRPDELVVGNRGMHNAGVRYEGDKRIDIISGKGGVQRIGFDKRAVELFLLHPGVLKNFEKPTGDPNVSERLTEHPLVIRIRKIS